MFESRRTLKQALRNEQSMHRITKQRLVATKAELHKAHQDVQSLEQRIANVEQKVKGLKNYE